MSIPNTVVKFVHRTGEIREFDVSKIADAIAECIKDVEDSHLNLPQRRARNYAERITEKIYRQYYDLDWLAEEFLVHYANYEEHERERRLDDAFVTERLTFVLLETFKDTISSRNPAEEEEKLQEYILDELESAELEPHYTHTLFPKLSKNELVDITDFLKDKVLQMAQSELDPDVKCPTQEFIQDTIEQELKKFGEVKLAEGYMIYREGRKKIKQDEISELQFTSNGVHEDIVRRTNKWNIDHQCHTILELNKWVRGEEGRDLSELIESAENRFLGDVRETAEDILDNKEQVKLVLVAGPSCSNKTTTTIILDNEMSKEGLNLKQLNVDDYFHDLSKQPKDKHGDYDFEMPEAIDMELLNEHLDKLTNGEPIDKPVYSFEEGKRIGTERFECEQDEIILIDCLHGLYRKLSSSVPNRAKYRIYIESMNVVRNINGNYTQWADVRMLKRMIRDSRYRGYSMERTLAHWPYVRKGELKHIIPYIFTTDAVINSGIPYELPVLKTVIKDDYPDDEFINQLREDGKMAPYIRGHRTKALLKSVSALDGLEIVPDSSPLREFIGGSSYDIPHND